MGSVEWRPVAGYEGFYEASSLGQIRRVGGRVLRDLRASNGYLQVNLWREGRCQKLLIHRLVAIAFLGAAPTSQHQVNHRDAAKTNNAVTNLEWNTPGENSRHSTALGRNRGNRQPSELRIHSKLTVVAVREIRRSTAPAQVVASRYGVNVSAIRKVRNRETWKQVE